MLASACPNGKLQKWLSLHPGSCKTFLPQMFTLENETLDNKAKILFYYMATMVRALWLAAILALFSCNDRALPVRYPRHIQSVFNLIVDILMNIHVMANWQLSQRVSADQCHMTLPYAQVYNSVQWCVFLSYSLTNNWF